MWLLMGLILITKITSLNIGIHSLPRSGNTFSMARKIIISLLLLNVPTPIPPYPSPPSSSATSSSSNSTTTPPATSAPLASPPRSNNGVPLSISKAHPLNLPLTKRNRDRAYISVPRPIGMQGGAQMKAWEG